VTNDPQYKRSAERLGQEIRQCSPAYAADVVQAFVRERTATARIQTEKGRSDEKYSIRGGSG
jgi:hypothetical protein